MIKPSQKRVGCVGAPTLAWSEPVGYFIYSSRTGNTWRLIEESQSNGIRTRNVISKEAYRLIGLRPEMTLVEARERAKQINLQNRIEDKKAVKAAERVFSQKLTDSAYLPEMLANGFYDELKENYTDSTHRLVTVSKHWQVAQKVISKLGIDSKDFFTERTRIYNFYRDKKWSPDYIKRINRMLNLWGSFVGRRRGSFYQPIPKLTNLQSQRIVEGRESVKGVRQPAIPLSWQSLKSKKASFVHRGLESQYNWLFIGLWLGLRPMEIDNLKKPNHFRLEKHLSGNTVIMVYQTKLTSLPKDKRWKPIPLVTSEQKEALRLIESKNFKRPLNKTLLSIFDSPIESYSPRKGFTDLMLSVGFKLEDISVFLGHSSIEITWRHYKDKLRFNLPRGMPNQ